MGANTFELITLSRLRGRGGYTVLSPTAIKYRMKLPQVACLPAPLPLKGVRGPNILLVCGARTPTARPVCAKRREKRELHCARMIYVSVRVCLIKLLHLFILREEKLNFLLSTLLDCVFSTFFSVIRKCRYVYSITAIVVVECTQRFLPLQLKEDITSED